MLSTRFCSAAVSVKMNVLLYAPPLLLLMLKVHKPILYRIVEAGVWILHTFFHLLKPSFICFSVLLLIQAMDFMGVISALAGAALVQVLILY